ncbi:MAG TPA: MotA/TolQ/ExbB proton channel family protein [Pirellulales bacterium]
MSRSRLLKLIALAAVMFMYTSPSFFAGLNVAGAQEEAAEEVVEGEAIEQKSYLVWMIESSGPIGAILLVLSFFSVALTARALMELRRSVVVPPELINAFEEKLAAKQYQEAYDLAAGGDSFLARVMAAGLRRLTYGYNEAVDAMQKVGEDESMRMEHRLAWLAIIGTIGPLLGLVGTVEGIIQSFRVIAQSDSTPKPSLLAEGISTSLFNTFEGLSVAILALIAFMTLKNWAARLTLDVELASDRLMHRFKGMSNQVAKPRPQSI